MGRDHLPIAPQGGLTPCHGGAKGEGEEIKSRGKAGKRAERCECLIGVERGKPFSGESVRTLPSQDRRRNLQKKRGKCYLLVLLDTYLWSSASDDCCLCRAPLRTKWYQGREKRLIELSVYNLSIRIIVTKDSWAVQIYILIIFLYLTWYVVFLTCCVGHHGIRQRDELITIDQWEDSGDHHTGVEAIHCLSGEGYTVEHLKMV